MPIKIGFVLSSNLEHPIPSTRIAVLNMIPFLRAADFDPHIVFNPTDSSQSPDVSGLAQQLVAEGFQIVGFQKVGGPSVISLVRELSAAGIKTVLFVCDVVDVAMASATDATIIVTDYLRGLYPPELQSKMHVVHDGIEQPEQFKVNWSEHSGSSWQPLRAVLVTSSTLARVPVLGTPPSWLEVVVVGRYSAHTNRLRRLREMWWIVNGESAFRNRLASIRCLLNNRIVRFPWNPVDVYKVMLNSDIGIIPIERSPEFEPDTPSSAWRCKSENRLTMKMGVGLPVVATPIPSYEQVVEQGRNGFLAESRREFLEHLETLRDPKLRREVGERARASVLERYSMTEQARRLVKALRAVIADSESGRTVLPCDDGRVARQTSSAANQVPRGPEADTLHR